MSLPVEVLLGISFGLLVGLIPAFAVGLASFLFEYYGDRSIPGFAAVLVALPLAGANGYAVGLVGTTVEQAPRLLIAALVALMLVLYANSQGNAIAADLPGPGPGDAEPPHAVGRGARQRRRLGAGDDPGDRRDTRRRGVSAALAGAGRPWRRAPGGCRRTYRWTNSRRGWPTSCGPTTTWRTSRCRSTLAVARRSPPRRRRGTSPSACPTGGARSRSRRCCRRGCRRATRSSSTPAASRSRVEC
ncbi:hypothetical protein ACFQL4_19230 [Halosimplex aquaticum]